MCRGKVVETSLGRKERSCSLTHHLLVSVEHFYRLRNYKARGE